MYRLVVIDDEYIVVQGIKALLSRLKLDYEVVGAAYDGIQGLEVIRNEKPDVVITDIRIPGLDGLSVIEAAKDECPDTNFIVISGYSEFAYAQRALTLGVKDYIDKPVTAEKLKNALARVESGWAKTRYEDDKKAQANREKFQELDKIAKPECIFASNTSSLSITEIGNGLTRPMVGMHFFNPADRMKLIEVIAGVNTPAETVEAIKKISVEIGKTPVQVNEAAGFVVNRILIPMINEAAFIKMEGVSDIAGIDAAMKLGANHPMGPLELGDFIGLDICLAIMDVLYNETGDSKYRACPLIRKMVRGGNLGAKSGKGFYVYNADRTKTPVDAQ